MIRLDSTFGLEKKSTIWFDLLISSKEERSFRRRVRTLPKKWMKVVASDEQYVLCYIYNQLYWAKSQLWRKKPRKQSCTPCSLEEDEEIVVIGIGEKGERRKGNDGALMPGFDGTLVRSLASVEPAPRQGVTVGTEFSYFPCHLWRKTLVYSQWDTEHTVWNCCGKTIWFLAGLFMKGWKGFLNKFPVQYSQRHFFSFEF